ncbi:uncharacterized protein VTP21DRAFT_8599 [Calcarisporiella thermophila]|uniref:uncharacterized protein n=1 Tax=Calcarisporiella thermophila TaxID=911321 RepID=UPI00374243F8
MRCTLFFFILATTFSLLCGLGSAARARVYTKCARPGTFAITFDDGPYIYTEQLVDWLNKNKFVATFFVNGDNWGSIYDYAAVLRKAYNAGHLIASHTWSHADLTKLSTTQIRTEMTRLEAALKKILGVRPTFMRPPYGSCKFLLFSSILIHLGNGKLTDAKHLFRTPANNKVLDTLGNLGYKVILWDIDTLDYNGDVEASKNIYETSLQNSNSRTDAHIALQHDVHQATVDQLAKFAYDYVHKKGYRTVTVAECLGFGKGAGYRK